MKKIPLFAAMLLAVLLLGGCTAPPDSRVPEGDTASKLDSIPFSDHHGYAVAYLGYQEMSDLEYYVENYLDSDKIPTYYLSAGDYYLVIPRYSGTELSLYQNDIETAESALLVLDTDCRAFILQCNASDIFADATVCLTYNGESVEFSPFISLMDGSVDVGENGLNLTRQQG